MREVFCFLSVKAQDRMLLVSVCMSLLKSISLLHLFSLSPALVFTLSFIFHLLLP